jgi:hypothetical protein
MHPVYVAADFRWTLLLFGFSMESMIAKANVAFFRSPSQTRREWLILWNWP